MFIGCLNVLYCIMFCYAIFISSNNSKWQVRVGVDV